MYFKTNDILIKIEWLDCVVVVVVMVINYI